MTNRAPQSRTIGPIRPLTREDVAKLAEDRPKVNEVQRLKDSHHMLARCIASGMPDRDAAIQCGRSMSSVSSLKIDPSFQELVAHYRKEAHEKWLEGIDTFFDLATSNMVKAERMIADRLDKAEEEGELLPVKTLLDISRDAADRFGYGKKKEVTHNVNVDFAAKLQQARERSAKVIDQTPLATATLQPPVVSPSGGPRPAGDTRTHSPSVVEATAPFRRRA